MICWKACVCFVPDPSDPQPTPKPLSSAPIYFFSNSALVFTLITTTTNKWIAAELWDKICAANAQAYKSCQVSMIGLQVHKLPSYLQHASMRLTPSLPYKFGLLCCTLSSTPSATHTVHAHVTPNSSNRTYP
eukprot:392743-Pelagomonas_calceolata.AAC.2